MLRIAEHVDTETVEVKCALFENDVFKSPGAEKSIAQDIFETIWGDILEQAAFLPFSVFRNVPLCGSICVCTHADLWVCLERGENLVRNQPMSKSNRHNNVS